MDDHDPASETRFHADLAAIVGDEAAAKARFGIAVSGGPDSLALLLLARAALGPRIAAATVDHGLRPEAADEARYVAEVCAVRGIDHATLTLDSALVGNVQASARALRYRLLEGWRATRGLDFILTAHHADDQVETVVMRLNRSSGVAGLAGIRRRNRRIVRPLLGWTRDELGDVLAEAEMPFVDDPSNRDHRYDRARLRSALADADWIDPKAVVKSAALLDDADEAIAWMCDLRLRRALKRDRDGWHLRHDGEPDALWHRMLLTVLQMAEPGLKLGEATYKRLSIAMRRGGKASVGTLTVAPMRGEAAAWTIAKAPARRPVAIPDSPVRSGRADRG